MLDNKKQWQAPELETMDLGETAGSDVEGIVPDGVILYDFELWS